MAERLVALVQSTSDIYLLAYVVQNLAVGENETGEVAMHARTARRTALEKKLYLTLLPSLGVQLQHQRVALARLRQEGSDLLKGKLSSLRTLTREDDQALAA